MASQSRGSASLLIGGVVLAGLLVLLTWALAGATLAAAPTYSGPSQVDIDEDSTLYFPAPSVLAWFNDSDGDAISIQAQADHLTLVDLRSSNGTLSLWASTPDYNGWTYINYTLTDSTNASSFANVSVHVLPVNDPPRISPLPPVLYAQQGQLFHYQLNATDPDDAYSGPPGTTFYWTDDTNFFDVVNGTIEFTPTNAQVGSWQIVVRVNDSQLLSAVSFQLVVNNTNDPPVLPATAADIIVSQDQFYSGTDIVATDLDLALWEKGVAESLVYSDDTPLFNVETVASPKPTGEPQYLARISFRPTNEQVGTWHVNITVTDAAGANATVHLRVIVNNVNDSPSGVRVNITSLATGNTTGITVPNSRVSFYQDDVLTIWVTADDPDLHLRVNDPTSLVDPSEELLCLETATFVGSLGFPQPDYVKPTVDADCTGKFEPGNEEVGTFTVVVTVRDHSYASISFRFQLQVLNVNDPPTNVTIASPQEGFNITGGDSLALVGHADDIDSPYSTLAFAWDVVFSSGRTYHTSGSSAAIMVEADQEDGSVVGVRLTVTDNLEIADPIVVVAWANGTYSSPTVPPLGTAAQAAPINNSTFHFAATVSNGNPPFVLVWTFGDGTTATGVEVNHTYTANGTYAVRLNVTDSQSASASASLTVVAVVDPPQGGNGPSAPPGPPSITVVASPVAGSNESGSFNFTVNATGDGGPYTFHWDFGDGNESTDRTPAHAYAASGNYTVVVTVTAANGTSYQQTKVVNAQVDQGPGPGGPPEEPGVGPEVVAAVVVAAVALGALVLYRLRGRGPRGGTTR